MARRFYSSTAARTTLAAGVDGSQSTMSVTAVSGWPTSFPYTLIIDVDTVNEEIIEVTGRSGTTITVTRGVDGTSGTSHDAGAVVQHGVSARDFDEPNAFINGTGTVTETLLASGSVTEAKLGTGAVTSAKILDGTIVNADINASAAIAQSKIEDLTSDLASKVDYALPVNAQTGTTYTFVLADAEKLTTASNAAAVTLTIPPQSSVTWPDNTVLRVVNYGAGAVTVDGGSGVTVTNTATTIAQYGAAVAIRTGSDAWTLVPFGGGDVPAAEVSSPAATGQYTDSGITYDYYTFTASGTLTVTQEGVLDFVIVGGGGSGTGVAGGNGFGGGQGGSFQLGTVLVTTGSYTVTVGGGGSLSSIAFDTTFTAGAGGNGNQSSGGNSGQANTYLTDFVQGGAGGGGGGGGGNGGGGAPGIRGLAHILTGTESQIAGGGGGGGSGPSGAGGAGKSGGGNGGTAGTSAGTNGTANTGGGGGGAPGDGVRSGGTGGSGVVIVRVRTS